MGRLALYSEAALLKVDHESDLRSPTLRQKTGRTHIAECRADGVAVLHRFLEFAKRDGYQADQQRQ